jgi:hypothetical protein
MYLLSELRQAIMTMMPWIGWLSRNLNFKAARAGLGGGQQKDSSNEGNILEAVIS